MKPPNTVSSQISSRQELDAFLTDKGLSAIDKGIALDSADTGTLSSHLESFKPDHLQKLYKGRSVCGRIYRNGIDSYASLFPRVDGNDIDFDVAIWDQNNQLSTIYHPTFKNRTSPSADVIKELDDIYALGAFQVTSLSSIAPTVYAAFQYCKEH